MKKNDLIVLLLLGIVLCASFVVTTFFVGDSEAEKLVVVVNNEVYRVHSLSDDGVYEVNIEDDYHNTYEIKDGMVSMIDANCRDGICTGMKTISKNGEMIICLPHKLYLKIEGAQEDDIDAVVE